MGKVTVVGGKVEMKEPVTYDPVLENNTWEQISKAARKGVASKYWSVGDTKTIDFGGVTYRVQIIGFDHDNVTNSGTYGRSKAGITFQFGVANSSTENGVCAEAFGTTLDGGSGAVKMNSTDTNSGGWASSGLRTTIMPIAKSRLPADLQNALVAVSKATYGGSSTDELFLLSEIEVFGARTNSNSGEGSQYAFYAAGNSRIRYRASTKMQWWLRSPKASHTTYFCGVSPDGFTYSAQASSNVYMSFAFCV